MTILRNVYQTGRKLFGISITMNKKIFFKKESLNRHSGDNNEKNINSFYANAHCIMPKKQ